MENWDKVGHLALYFIFALLGYGVFSKRKHYYYLCSGIVIYGGLMEVAQSFMPGRMMSIYDFFYDFLANAVGVAIGMIFSWLLLRDKTSYSDECKTL